MSDSPVYAVQKQPSLIDYRGHLTALVFVSGCNFRCGFCHNASLLQKRQIGISWERLGKLCRQFADHWVDAVTISGGEPTIWPELLDLIEFFRGFGFAIKLDTNGSHPERLKQLLPFLDYVAMDLKGAPQQYAALTGFDHPDRLQASIDLLRGWDKEYEFRTTLVEGLHDEERMAEMAAWIAGATLYVLQPFLPHPDIPDPSLRDKPRTSDAFLHRMAKIAEPHVEKVLVIGD